ncbi:MAG: S26 family signal peptidase [Cyanobacteria bacterium P01_A01_bin.105]
MTVPPPIARASWREIFCWLGRRRRRYQVVERSMLPTLQPGDTVLAAPLNLSHKVLNGARAGSVRVGDIVIARHPTQANLLLIKRVKETFYDGGCYLISDNLAEPTAQDSRSFGVIAADQLVARITCLLT